MNVLFLIWLICSILITGLIPGKDVPGIRLDNLALALEDIASMEGSKLPYEELSGEINSLRNHWDSAVFEKLQKKILLQNPRLPGQLVFVVRKQYKKDHHNTATIFQKGEINTSSFTPGASLNIFHVKTGRTTKIFETNTGCLRDPEISFGGDKIIFSYRKDIDDDYHIYEIQPDGTGLKQLTFASGVSDIDPLYMPDGRIVFSSTREPKYCMCNRHIMANLYSMNPDGSNIIQLGKSTLFEGHPALMNDGSIIYDRWEYVDRNFGDAQGLWTVNPDGTKHAIYFGNNTNSPGGVIDPRQLPGSNLILCIFTSCHDRPWGALTLLDRSKGVDGKEAVVKIWPDHAVDLIGKGNWDTFMSLNVRYEDPFPLTQKYFLVSRSIWLEKNKGHTPVSVKMGIFLVDVFGNELLLYKDENLSCFDPMPLAPRHRPFEILSVRKYDDSPGVFYVQNVYEGTHMENVVPGAVKYLRVIETPEKRTYTEPAWGGQGQQAPGVNWHNFEIKRVLGTVPVESDGSANFEVPPGRFVYFQLLDEHKKMIQSMRSGVMIHPGETYGCIGCHENRLSAPMNLNRMPLALRKEPRKLDADNSIPPVFNYASVVQPIFDKHCVQCHDFGKEAGEKLVLAGDRNPFFNASYIDLHVKKQIHCVGGGPASIQQAYSWGSHASNLTKVLEHGHQGIELSDEELEAIYSWIDLNGVYYPEYESAYPDNPAGRSPLTFEELNRLGLLTGVDFQQLSGHQRELGPQISFERPSQSPCLVRIQMDGAGYLEALDIIKRGQERLMRTPRAEMEGFVPCEAHRIQLSKYMERLKVEEKNNQAVATGNKLFDQ